MIAYKVVSEDKGKLVSSNIINYYVEYEIGKVTYPSPQLEGSYLFVFDTLENAKQKFNNTMGFERYKLYECEVDEVIPYDRVPHCFASKQQFWDDFNKHKDDEDGWCAAPIGTLFTKSVKLTKRISI